MSFLATMVAVNRRGSLALALLAAALVACHARARPRATPHAVPTPIAQPAVETCGPPPVCPALPPPIAPASLPQWSRIEAMLARGNGDGSIDPAELDLLISQALDPSVDIPGTLLELDAMAAVIRARLPARCDDRCRVRAINQYLFAEQGYRSEFDPSGLYLDVSRDLIDRVLATHVGYCEGLSYLYLGIARRVGVLIAPVRARQHMYVRYVGPEAPAFDIDPTQEGRAPLRVSSACQAAPGVYGVALDDRAMAGELLGLVAMAGGVTSPAWLDRAVELAPLSPQLRNNRGLARAQRFDAPGALEDYHAARQLDPCGTLYAMNEARLLYGQGRVPEATALLDEYDRRTAVGGGADEGRFLISLVRSGFAFEARHDDEAERWLMRALDESDGAPVALEAFASERILLGRTAEAVSAMRTALLADPSVRTRVGLLIALLENGDAAAAATQLERVARDPRGTGGSLDLHIALVAAAQGRTDLAETAARRCLDRLGRRCARALVVLGDVARWRGHPACARGYYQAWLACPAPVQTRGLLHAQDQVRERIAGLEPAVALAR